MKHYFCLVVSLGLVLLGQAIGADAIIQPNLVPNGDLEQADALWRASGKVREKNKQYAILTQDQAHAGKSSLKLFMPKAMQTVRWQSPVFPCNGTIQTSLWLKTARLQPQERGWLVVRMAVMDNERKPVQVGRFSWYTLVFLNQKRAADAEEDWRNYTKKIILPAKVKYARIDFLAYQCTGMAWLDDVVVRQSQAAKPTPGVSENKKPASKTLSAIEQAEEDELVRLQATKIKSGSSRSLNFLYGLKEGTPLLVEDVEIKGEVDQENKKAWMEKAPQITIKDSDLFKDGRPVFLAWWWLGADTWHDKMLGFDCTSYHIYNRAPMVKAKKEKNHVRVYWDKLSLSDITHMQRILNLGRLPFIHFYENKHSSILKRLAPDRLINSHYWLYCDEDPQTARIRRNSWKAVLRITRNYPSFVYNLNNETYYMDYCIWNIRAFRKRMRVKYGNIETANKIWQTTFTKFDNILPPYSPNSITHTRDSMQNFTSHMLWLDWLKFTEARFAETVKRQRDDVKAIDPAARVCIKSPSGFMIRADRGIYPPSVAKVMDLYCAEISTRYFNQYPGEEVVDEIKSMLSAVLRWDVVRNACRDKPLIADESSPFPVDKLSRSQFLFSAEDMAEWRFRPSSSSMDVNRYTRDQGQQDGWWREDYDDGRWQTMKAPAIWGQEGFKDTTIAWYRKRITIPKSEQVYLNGHKLADYAHVYINGELVKTTSSWKERFSVEITGHVHAGQSNTIAIRIVNKYKQGGFIWGGIRGYVTITRAPTTTRLRAGQMRSHFWTALVHGCSGLGMFKYPKDPQRYSIETLRILPYMKKEMQTVAKIILPRPRIKGQVALFYPYESLRYRLPADWAAAKKNPVFADFMDVYAGAMFAGIDIDLVRGDEPLSQYQKYPVVVVKAAARVHPRVIKLLHNYVKQGGILVMGEDCLKTNDETDQPLPEPEFLQGPKIEQTDPLPVLGVEMRAANQGMVFRVPRLTSMQAWQKLLPAILRQKSIRSAIRIVPAIPGSLQYVERHLFTRNGKTVIYLHNWGAPGKARVLVPGLPAADYRVRDVETGRELLAGNLREKGLTLLIRSQSPHILLVEPTDSTPVPMAKLSPAHDAFMQRIWRKSPVHTTKVLMYTRGQRNADKRSNQHVLMPTLPLLLDAEDMQVDVTYKPLREQVRIWDYCANLRDAKLSDYRVLFIPSPIDMSGRFGKDELRVIRNYVAAGGGLFVCGLNNYGIHMSSRVASSAVKVFGLSIPSVSLINKNACIMGDPRFMTFDADSFADGHPVLAHVNAFQSMGSTMVRADHPLGKPLPLITADLKGSKVPILLAMNYGKGRILVMGESSWMWPEWLKKADNAQLAVNIFRWLARENPQPIDTRKVKDAISLFP